MGPSGKDRAQEDAQMARAVAAAMGPRGTKVGGHLKPPDRAQDKGSRVEPESEEGDRLPRGATK